jgi:hypothetical protein
LKLLRFRSKVKDGKSLDCGSQANKSCTKPLGRTLIAR